MQIIVAILGALLLFIFQKYLYRRFWQRNLSVHISFSEESAYEGEELLLQETIINKKFLPLPVLRIKFMTSRNLSFLDTDNSVVTDNYYRNDTISILMYQKVIRSLPFICSHRGYYTINNINAVCWDIFLSSSMVSTYHSEVHLYVYPKPLQYDKIQPIFQKILGTVLTKRYFNEDPFEFRTIREYQSYDNLKSVNWNASAKTGSLKVNVHDYTNSQQVKILLDLALATTWMYEDIQEESIRITAAVASAFIDQGIPTGIYTNAPDLVTRKLCTVPSGSSNLHRKAILEALARIDTTAKLSDFVPMLQDELLQSTENDYIIIISTVQTEGLQMLLSNLLHTKTKFSWIVPFNHEIKLSVKEELLPYVQPWELSDT